MKGALASNSLPACSYILRLLAHLFSFLRSSRASLCCCSLDSLWEYSSRDLPAARG